MTDKPMLSVEREVIEKALRDALTIRFDTDSHVTKLRAILDKPDECRCKRYGKDNPHWPCPVHAEPSAQHQGDPVAWSYCPECGCEELHHECGEHKQCKNCHQEWFRDIDYSEVVRGNLQKLKADQPAPVAVVMPERMADTWNGNRDYLTYDKGWNDALADVARLNGVKP